MLIHNRHTLIVATTTNDVDTVVKVARGLERERLIRWLVREVCPHMPLKTLAAATNTPDRTYVRTLTEIVDRVRDVERVYK